MINGSSKDDITKSKGVMENVKLIVLTMFLSVIGISTTLAGDGDDAKYVKNMLATSKSNGDCDKVGPDSAKTMINYSLYREYFKQDNHKEAFPYWRYVYANAPGLRKQIYTDGEKLYTSLIQETEDETQKQAYVDTLFQIYDKRIACYDEESYVLGKKGSDIIKYRSSDLVGAKEVFEAAMEAGGNETRYYYLLTYFKILVNLKSTDHVDGEYVFTQYEKIDKIVQYNIDNNEKYSDKFKDVQVKIEDLLSKVEGVFECDDLIVRYKEQYNANPTDIDNIKSIYATMRSRGCTEDPFYDELMAKWNEIEPNSQFTKILANRFLREKNYDQAIEMLTNAVGLEEDPLEKADLNYSIAEILYSEKKYQDSREYARKAIGTNPNFGKAYLLIGKLYASSGSLCGPGTGFESQKVIWPALDKFYKAKSVDSSVAEEAQRLINKYSGYLPEKQELFMRGNNDGDAFFVGCWIQENTTIRSK